MILLTIVLFLVLIIFMIIGYFVVTDSKIPEWVYFWKRKSKEEQEKEKKEEGGPAPDTKALGYCIFEGEDLYNKNVHTYDGKQVSVDVSPILCSTCNKYVYKTEDGCTRYIFDYLENTNEDDSALLEMFCDPAHPERDKTCIQPHGTCTPSMAPSKKCAF